MSQHKATEERRYWMELAVVICVGLALAVVAVVTILSINPATEEDPAEFGGAPVPAADRGSAMA